MHRGRVVASGSPAEVLTKEHLAAVYGISARYATLDGVPIVLATDVLP
jgi:ABC-type hemin transport system ATPase subunit